MAHDLLRRCDTGAGLACLRAYVDRECRHALLAARELGFRPGDPRLALVEDGQPQLYRWADKFFAARLALVGHPDPERAQIAQLPSQIQSLGRGVRALLGCREVETLGYGLRFDLL